MGAKVDLQERSRIPGGSVVLRYPAGQVDLATELTKLLVEKGFVHTPVPLGELHRHVSQADQVLDQHLLNNVTTAFYETSSAFLEGFHRLVVYLAEQALGFDFVFQATPTIRFHFPVPLPEGLFRGEGGEFLGQHNDGMLGHSHEEINCWVPLVDCRASAALQIAPLDVSLAILRQFAAAFEFDRDTYHQSGRSLFYDRLLSDRSFGSSVVAACGPLPMKYGELVLFDSRALHGTAENHEPLTRISIDFRLMPLDRYEALDAVYTSQGRSGRRFVRGDVFDTRTAMELAAELRHREPA